MKFTNEPPYDLDRESRKLYLTNLAIFYWRFYAWICGAVLIMTLVKFLLPYLPASINPVSSQPPSRILGICLALLAIIMFCLLRKPDFVRDKVHSLAIKGCFLLFAVLTGAALSIIQEKDITQFISKAFLSLAGVYAAIAFYGYFTKSSLKYWVNFIITMAGGFTIAMIITFFQGNSFDEFFYFSLAGIFLVAIITGSGHEQMVSLFLGCKKDSKKEAKSSIIGALKTFVDLMIIISLFINLDYFIILCCFAAVVYWVFLKIRNKIREIDESIK
jgi:FtsH-binding integral membrane protein